MNLSNLDLNLLVVLEAVLEERSATLAAARLHLTQSAVSNALGRARAVFEDPLVIRNGRGFVLTPRAEALLPRLRGVLEEVRSLVGNDASSRPETTTRCFTIACADAVGAVVFPRLLPRFEARFPRATLRSVTLDRLMTQGGLERADIDLLVGIPPDVPAGCEAEDLFEDRMVAIVRADHPEVGRSLRLETYARLPHAELALFGEPEDRVDRALATHGLRRHVQVMVPHITTLPLLVAGSDRVATVMECVARAHEPRAALRILEPPVELAPLVVRLLWHRRTSDDEGCRLLRALVHEAMRGAPLRARRRAGADRPVRRRARSPGRAVAGGE
ncbi:LysR family transcriptional regulator [Paraliomyxa miuraensis]|uniref:LysR family transcriptional regulator n=1 Tax=Paraliomyxa miuraensis TaxID=376150 RepID=UPI0022550CEB|nr:LysR family transcriptional regulator [Paraliomyxa miuraensis]MCX4240372.1 LysR family transcriptional regulator [Paraliomyxa miuraensis]